MDNNVINKKKLSLIIISILSISILISVYLLYSIVFTRFSIGVVPTEEQINNSTHYDQVVIFGVDGAGAYFKDGNVPNFDRIYENGCVSYKVYSQYPTTSAHNWTSMFHGVRYQKHQVDNDVAGNSSFTNENYPSFFKLWSEFKTDAEMLSVVNWIPTNSGCIEENINGLTKINASEYNDNSITGTDTDEKVCNIILNKLDSSIPDILFMQFDSVDGAGHCNGYGSKAFSNALTRIDGFIGLIYDKYIEKGCGTNTLFITVSDHGHWIFGGHGYNISTQRYVTIAVAGGLGNINKGKMGHAVTQDIASIVAYSLGMKQSSNWESKVPFGIFSDLPNK